jgi:hypothetical protein
MAESGIAEMAEWELGFCKWAAAHQRARVKEQEAMATYLAGTPISWLQLRHLRATKAFRNWYGRYRAKILQRLDEHREAFESENVGKAIAAHSKAIDMAMAKEDYRAIPPLVEPAIKALYKNVEEHQDKPMIVLNLGNFAQAHLDDPVEEVEFEQLEPGEPVDESTS